MAMAAGYYALSRVGLAFVAPASQVATIWPASGLALAAFAIAGRSWWPWLAAGIFVGNLAAQTGTRGDLALEAALAAVNAAEPALAATVLLAVAGRDAPLALTTRNVGALVAAAVGATAAAALLGAAALTLRAGAAFGPAFAHWWLADAVGMLALAPLALIFGDRSVRAPARPRVAVLLLAATCAVTLGVFLQGENSVSVLRYAYLVFPFAILPALRLRAWLVAVNLALIVLIVAVATANQRGPFVRDDLSATDEVIVAQGYIAVLAVCALLVAAVVRQVRATSMDLEAQRATAVANEQRYRLLADHTADMISVHQVDGPATYVSPSALQVIGVPADQAIGGWAGALCHPDDREAVDAAQARAAAGHAAGAITYRMPQAGGAWRWLETSLQPVEDRGRVTEIVASTRDVSARIEAEEALRASEELHRLVLTRLPDAIVTVYDANLRILSLLGGAVAGAGLDPAEYVGRRLQDISSIDMEVLEPEFRAAIAGEERTFEYDSRLTERRFEISLVPSRGTGGTVTGVVAVSRDITARHEVALQLRHLAEHDPLTGLVNRRRFEEELARHASRVRRYGDDGAILLVDLDRFKEINDTLGHAAGDDHLVQAAQRLRATLRDTDVVARLGGDEFAILLPHADAGEAEETARRLVSAMHAPGETGVAMTVSVGVAAFSSEPDGDQLAVLAAADRAMYEAKVGGRDRYAVAGRSSNGAPS